jgi:hypothetical protein
MRIPPDRFDLAVAILKATDDGNRLYTPPDHEGAPGDGWQLRLVQDAVNGTLTEIGWMLFRALHRQVLVGDYAYPVSEFARRFCPELLQPVSA